MQKAHRRGTACEYIAAAHFANQGWTIFWTPNGISPCDFIMRRKGITKGVQVKSAAWHEKGRTRYLRASLRSRKAYVKSDFDFLVVVDPQSRLWSIPFGSLPDTALLYLEKERDGDVDKYEWEQWLIKT